jgi:hypothetical protein
VPSTGFEACGLHVFTTVEKNRAGYRKLVPGSVQLAFARQGAKEQRERDDDWHRSDDSYSPRRHWCFRSPTISVGPRFAYRRVMTLRQLSTTISIGSLLLIRTSGIWPVLGGANGEESTETVRGIAHLAPRCSRHRCEREASCLSQPAPDRDPQPVRSFPTFARDLKCACGLATAVR